MISDASAGVAAPVTSTEIFTKYARTHNTAVFDAYTPEMKKARHSHIVTGLPDTYGRGRIVGDSVSYTHLDVYKRQVMPSITICTFLTLTNSFKLFDQNLSLTGGEPAKQTMMLAYNIYDTLSLIHIW